MSYLLGFHLFLVRITLNTNKILYILRSLTSPSLGDSVQDTFTKITAVSYDFEDEEFDDISLEAKSFISHLLINKMEDRLTAEECLHHPWLSMETKRVMKTLKKDNLKKFLTRRRWQRGAQAVLALKRIVSASVLKTDDLTSDDDDEDLNHE